MKKHTDPVTDHAPPKQWGWLLFRLIWWPMWRHLPFWCIRFSFRYRYLMLGPWELRWGPEPKDGRRLL